MADEKFTFEQARIRLEEIAAEVRKKDTSLEKSLDLLEEGVRLANICTELVDHVDTSATVSVPVEASEEPEGAGEPEAEEQDEADGAQEPASDSEAEGFDEADDDVAESADAEADE